MTDWLVLALIVLTFAVFCTVHVALAAAIGARGPWWRGVVAFVVAPLALYWGVREKLLRRSIAWAGSLLLYVAARLVAAFLARA